jgi:hypothetical protein
LRDSVGAVEKEGDDFLEGHVADVDGAMNTIGRLDPVHFADRNVPGERITAIAELDLE